MYYLSIGVVFVQPSCVVTLAVYLWTVSTVLVRLKPSTEVNCAGKEESIQTAAVDAVVLLLSFFPFVIQWCIHCCVVVGWN
mgnify:CR=1 FL=1